MELFTNRLGVVAIGRISEKILVERLNMIFEKSNYLIYVLMTMLITWMLILYKDKKNREILNLYFFKKENVFYWLRSMSFCIGTLLMGMALLELKGPAEKVEFVSKQMKTAIVIDTSASMLVEDIKPNRFQKSLMIAQHYVKKSVNEKISIFIFSATLRQVVPFTDDVDHLNARIEALNKIGTVAGSSDISVSINEVNSYFKKDKASQGNILLITDGEEHQGKMKVALDDSISLAVIGVGTAKGGQIPIRDRYGSLRGYKKYKGSDVVSKLNENFFKQGFSNVKNYYYWIVSGYSIPTEEILTFFNNEKNKNEKKGLEYKRPLLNYYLTVPGILFIILSYFFGFFRQFNGVIAAAFFVATLMLNTTTALYAFDEDLFNKLTEKHKRGEISKEEEKYLASLYLEKKEFDKARKLYKESINFPEYEESKTLANYGTALLANKELEKGINMLELALEKSSDSDKEFQQQLRENILLALKKKKEEEQKKKNKDKDKDKKKDKEKNENKNNKDKDKKNEKDKNNEKDSQSKEDKKQQGEKKDKEKDKKSGNDKSDNKKEDEVSEKSEEEKKKNKNKDEKGDPKDKLNKRERDVFLKEILNNDKRLQKKLLNTSTEQERGSNVKDW